MQAATSRFQLAFELTVCDLGIQLLGFGLSLPYMGWVNLEHPLKPLYGDKWVNDVADDLF